MYLYVRYEHSKKWFVLVFFFVCLFLVKISKKSYIKILLLDEQNYLRYLVLFPGGGGGGGNYIKCILLTVFLNYFGSILEWNKFFWNNKFRSLNN